MIAAHYDVVRRHCHLHRLGQGTAVLRGHYLAEIHTLRLLIGDVSSSHAEAFFLDLTTGECLAAAKVASRPRIQQALANVDRRFDSRSEALAAGATVLAPSSPSHCDYRLGTTGSITFRRVGHPDRVFVPLADGKPLLRSASISAAQVAGDVFAVCAGWQNGKARLILFRGADGSMLREHHVKSNTRFLLSNDGRWLAQERGPRVHVEKVDVPSEGAVTRCGGFSAEGRLYLGDRCFLLSLGKAASHRHVVRWSDAGVQFQYEHKKLGQDGFHTVGFAECVRYADLAVGPWTSASSPVKYDPQRFLAGGVRDGATFALDRFGQVAVFDAWSGVVLCMFMAFRDRLAAWLPDGSRCGSEALGLGPETPGARQKLARVLMSAGKQVTS
jgi:hypothetical protein